MQAFKQCLRTFIVKIADIFDQKNSSPYLGVSHKNFTIWDDEKETAVIYRIKQRAEKVPSISEVCQNKFNLHNTCIIPVF